MTPARFEQVEEGDELPPAERMLGKDDVREYARVNGIDFARFTDDEGARKEGLPGMIAPGNMSMGLLATFVERWAGAGGLRRLGTTFRGLVLPGNPITLRGVVTTPMPSSLRRAISSGPSAKSALCSRRWRCGPGFRRSASSMAFAPSMIEGTQLMCIQSC